MWLRAATREDVDALAATVAEGFDTYLEFAPPGWRPDLDRETAVLRERLDSPEVWCAVAEDEGQVAGHAVVLPAAVAGHPEPDPALAHLWSLFVRRRWWGTGVAAALLAEAVAAAGERGFERMRLFTPADHARARRFYEREGWAVAGKPAFSQEFGMTLVEYRRPLDDV